jgi:predicted kinase
MKTMIIVRGVPGSGKSTFVNLIQGMARASDTPRVISLDKYRMVQGKYVFDPARERDVVSMYHSEVAEACASEEPVIILDNVHSRFWEMERARKMGEAHGYRIFVIEVQQDFWTCLQRMRHPVPFEKLKEIFERWESHLQWSVATRLDGVERLLSRMLRGKEE